MRPHLAICGCVLWVPSPLRPQLHHPNMFSHTLHEPSKTRRLCRSWLYDGPCERKSGGAPSRAQFLGSGESIAVPPSHAWVLIYACPSLLWSLKAKLVLVLGDSVCALKRSFLVLCGFAMRLFLSPSLILVGNVFWGTVWPVCVGMEILGKWGNPGSQYVPMAYGICLRISVHLPSKPRKCRTNYLQLPKPWFVL